MSVIVIYDAGDRKFACRLIEKATPGTRVEMLPPKGSNPQRDRMWAMLGEVSKQYVHCGRRYEPDQWKILMMHACGQEVDFAPSLDGSTFIPFGGSSKKMGVAAMAELISFIEAWGAQNGVTFRG